MGSGTITLGGNWTNSGAFTAGTGKVNINGTAQTIRGMTYNNLTLFQEAVRWTTTGVMVNSILSIEGFCKRFPLPRRTVLRPLCNIIRQLQRLLVPNG